MSIITRALRQDAVYWSPEGVDQFGKSSFEAPVQIKVRYVQETGEIIAQDGTRKIFGAAAMVDRDLEVGGMLMLGTLNDVSDPTRPDKSGASEILSFTKTPNRKATEFLREVRVV